MTTKGKITRCTAIIAALALSAAVYVYADSGNGGNFASRQKLNLTDGQKQQLKESRHKQMESMKTVFEQMKANKEAFSQEIVKAAPDMAKISDLQSQAKALQGQMADNRLSGLLEVKKILTPEQFTRFIAEKKEHKFGRCHKHWRGHDKEGTDEE